jgi:hypothetical protein
MKSSRTVVSVLSMSLLALSVCQPARAQGWASNPWVKEGLKTVLQEVLKIAVRGRK